MEYLAEMIANCDRCRSELIDDGREDEADFQKIQANVYDISKTILAVAVKTQGHDAEAVKTFFLKKTEQLLSNWVLSGEAAMTHGDAERICVENIKLEAIQKIRKVFMQVWEEVA